MPEFQYTGGYDASLPSYHPRYRLDRTPDCINIFVRDQILEKFPGYIPFNPEAGSFPSYRSDDVSPHPVRLLVDFVLFNGDRYLVGVGASSDSFIGNIIYVFEPTRPSWQIANPQCGNGADLSNNADSTLPGYGTTVSGTAGQSVVTLSNYAWLQNSGQDLGLIQPGDFIMISGETYNYVASVNESNGQINLVNPLGSNHTASQYYTMALLSQVGQYQLRSSCNGNLCIIFNGVDRPVQWDGSSHRFKRMINSNGASSPTYYGTDLPPIARFMVPYNFGNVLVAGRIAGDPTAIWNSDIVQNNQYCSWTTSLGVAGYYPFHTGNGLLMGIDAADPYIYLFYQNGIYMGWWGGTNVDFQFQEVPAYEGVASAGSLLRFGAQGKNLPTGALAMWAWFGTTRLYMFDGQRVRPFGEEVRKWIFNKLDLNYPDSIISTCIPEWHVAMWSFPDKGDNGVNHYSIIYDYETNEWFPADFGFSCFGTFDFSNVGGKTWQQVSGSWSQQSGIWTPPGTIAQPIALVGDELGNVYWLSLYANANGSPINSYRKTPIFHPGYDRRNDKLRACDIQEVELVTRSAAGTTLQIDLWAAENIPQILGEPTVAQITQLEHTNFGTEPTNIAPSPNESYQVPVQSTGEVRQGFCSAGKAFQVGVGNAELFGQLGIMTSIVRVRVRNL